MSETAVKKHKTINPVVKRKKAEHGTSLLTAFREIRELIVHGRLSPGTWILEADLAEAVKIFRSRQRNFGGLPARAA